MRVSKVVGRAILNISIDSEWELSFKAIVVNWHNELLVTLFVQE